MRAQLFKSDAAGVFRALMGGNGFRVSPGLPSTSDTRWTVDQAPGHLPVRVQVDGVGEFIEYQTAGVQFPQERFGFLDVSGCEPSSWYLVESYERGEGMVPASRGARRGHRVAQQTIVPNGVPPVSIADGWKVRAGTQVLTFYAGGTPRVCDLYVMSLDNVWYDTGVDLDFTTEPVQTRYVDLPGDRVALVAVGAAMTVAVDASVEVG